MEKRNLIQKLAEALGPKAPAKTEESAEPAQTPPPARGEYVSSGEAGEDEPRPIGESVALAGPDASSEERLAVSLAETVETVDKSAVMLETQAKRQQQVTDMLDELSQQVRSNGEKTIAATEATESLRADLSRADRATTELKVKIEQAVTAVSTTATNSAELAERLDATQVLLEAISSTLGAGLDKIELDLADLRHQASANVAALRKLVIIAISVAAGALLAGMIF